MKIIKINNKYLSYFVTLLVLVAAFLFTINLQQHVNIIGSSNEGGILQVYFFENGKYSEERSISKVIQKDKIFDFTIKIPDAIERVRIDPINKIGQVKIYKASYGLHTIFDNLDYQFDFDSGVENTNALNLAKINDGGYIFASTSEDPSFEVKFIKVNNIYQKAKYFFILSVVIFLFVGSVFYFLKISSVINLNQFLILFIPLASALAFTSIFYPGFLNYDGLHALRGAIYGVKDSIWPPMVSYIWRIVNLITPDIWGMFFAQIYIFIFACFMVIYRITKNITYAAFCLGILFILPYISGPMSVIFKDVLMAAFFMIAIFFILIYKDSKVEIYYKIGFFAAIATLFIGVSTRHNAMAAALPIIFYMSLVHGARKRRGRVFVGVIFIILSCSVYFPKIALDRYTFPEFSKIQSPTDNFIFGIQVMDLAGGSICANENLFDNKNSKINLEQIKKEYDPRHVNLSLDVFAKVERPDLIDADWKSAFVAHPFCMLSNKILLTKNLLGFNQGPQFIITDPEIYSNEFGFVLTESRQRDNAVQGIVHSSQFFFMKPWFLYLSIIVGFVASFIKGFRVTNFVAMMLLSGAFYLVGLIMFGNAADARLTFYSSAVVFVAMTIQIWRALCYRSKLFII
jgi:hypothetical protein